MTLLKIKNIDGNIVYINPEYVTSVFYVKGGDSAFAHYLDKEYTVIETNTGTTFLIEKPLQSVMDELIKLKIQ